MIQFTKEIIIGQSVVYHFAQSYWAPGLALPDIYDFKCNRSNKPDICNHLKFILDLLK